MAKTMAQYMSKTRADYRSGVARPKIEDKDNFELKGQFLKELQTNTFSGSDHEDANEHIEKVLEINDLFHIPNITIDQVMLRAFPMSLTGAASHWLKNKPTDGGKSTTFSKNQVDTLPAWQSDSKEILILDSRGAIPSKTCTDARTVKYPKEISGNVLVGIGKFTFPVDFIILDMPKDIKVPLILGRPFLSTSRAKIDVYKRKISLRTLVLNRSSDPFLEDYIELNDLNAPFKLRRNQGDDLMPNIKECEVIKEFRTRDDELDAGIDDYPILENIDDYRDEGMGNVIFAELFLREVGINAKRFEGMITIYNGNDEVTYQTMRSHPRFKYHINEQCNKIPPLLKVTKEDKMNGISHPYQKLKGFYKGVLNLGPDYIRDTKMEEWLTRWNISVHEME
ncbi:putative reverse transcriptase domain-containing protein [Tanacetum coccineum]